MISLATRVRSPPPPPGPRLSLLLPLLLAGLAAGCAASDYRLRLRAMEIEGNDRVSDEEILSRLALEAEGNLAWSDRRYLDSVLFERDAQRIARVYRALGHYHARLDAVLLRWNRAGDGVVLTFRVTEGPPVVVSAVEVAGIDDLGFEVRKRVQEAIRFSEGDVITEDGWDASLAAIRRVLQSRGYPRPEVSGRVEIDDLADTARLFIEVVPGRFARFGELVVGGLETVPEEAVRAEVGIAPGDRYDVRRLEEAREALVALGVFSGVRLDEVLVSAGEGGAGEGGGSSGPGGDGEAEDRVDLAADLDEGAMQRLRAGFGLATEQGRQQVEVTADWEHRNLGGGLRKLAWNNRFGWAFDLGDLEDLGPFGSSALTFRQPNPLDPRLGFVTSLRYQAVPASDEYSTQSVQARLGGDRITRDRSWAVGLHNGLRWVDLYNVREGAQVADRPYLLYVGDLTFTLDLRDDPLEPRSGHYLSLLGRWGLDPRGGEYDDDPARDLYRFVTLKADFRGYYDLHPRLVLALRASAGLALPFGAESLVPPDERFFSGGANGSRGWPYHAVGTWRPCAETDPGCVAPPPPGGNTLWEFSAELRVLLVQDLSLALFFDAGNVIDGAFRTRFEETAGVFHPAVGAGLRYRTPIGPIRLDIGVPLQDDPRIAPAAPVAFHLTFGEAF